MPLQTYITQTVCHYRHTQHKPYATTDIHNTNCMPLQTYTTQTVCHYIHTQHKLYATTDIHNTNCMPLQTYTTQTVCHYRHTHNTNCMPLQTYTTQTLCHCFCDFVCNSQTGSISIKCLKTITITYALRDIHINL